MHLLNIKRLIKDDFSRNSVVTNLMMVISVSLFSLFLLMAFLHLPISSEASAPIVPINFKALKGSSEIKNPLSAQHAFTMLKDVTVLESKLDQRPYWISIDSENLRLHSQKLLALSTRHLSTLTCWSMGMQSAAVVAEVSGNQTRNITYQADRWVYRPENQFDDPQMICRMTFVGPAVLKVQFLDNGSLGALVANFERDRGFLEGGLTIMMGLVFVAALFNRSLVFVCFGFWLFGSLRLAAMNLGWDQNFFGAKIPLEYLPEARMIGMSIYFASTIQLVRCLFDNFKNRFWKPVLHFFELMSVILGLAAFFFSYKTFLLILWPVSLIACFVVSAVVLQHFLIRRNTVSGYYLVAILVISCGVVAEVLQASLGVDFFVRFFNPGTVTLLASAMTAVSLMEYVRNTQRQRELAAANMEKMHERLKNVFNIAPAAMFVADAKGQFIEYNQHFENEFLNEYGEPLFDFLKAPDLAALYAGQGEIADLKREEIRIGMGKGQVRWFELIWARDADDLVGVVSDFTSRKDRELALHHQATHDELTGALNRRGLEWAIQLKLDQGGTELQLYHLDIKRFRHVIRAYGLHFSDRVLKAFYTELYRYLCAFADLCRLHIDQFVVLVNQE